MGTCLLAVSWYAMMAVHELGHALAGIATGGAVERIAIPLLGFSHTDVHPNPQPLIVAWAGAVVGVVLPALLWLGVKVKLETGRAESLLRFFAGFCFLANGVYLGLGWIDRVGDTHELLQHGATTWQLIAFGSVCSATALLLWHGLGPWMGLADRPSCPRRV